MKPRSSRSPRSPGQRRSRSRRRSKKNSIDHRLKILKERESRLIKTILQLEQKKEKMKEGKKGKKTNTFYEKRFDGPLHDESDLDQIFSNSLDEVGTEGTDALSALLDKEADKDNSSTEKNPLTALREIFPKNFDIHTVEKEIQGLKSNAHKVEGLLKEADEALDSLVKSMGYMGVKPKRGSWAYRRWRKLQREGDRSGDSQGGLDIGALLNLASMFAGSGNPLGTAAGVTASPATGAVPALGFVGDLMKSPTVQNVLMNAATSFMKKGKFKLF
ncbi:hypothetical protein F9B85_07750 [Heliorestis acidaminivorans]|uniref:Uncharacterized protein n=1 Tax=Heliorestis acidaminivorans TaxID=553427 RepID=A0A6I0EZS6_9FIRM|nr:hypothetical protein [Heliorestis acidaminivorans]KAB2952551.1 hypothetical protein F9B85_07750 [Heliorestis acidaminivorans]